MYDNFSQIYVPQRYGTDLIRISKFKIQIQIQISRESEEYNKRQTGEW